MRGDRKPVIATCKLLSTLRCTVSLLINTFKLQPCFNVQPFLHQYDVELRAISADCEEIITNQLVVELADNIESPDPGNFQFLVNKTTILIRSESSFETISLRVYSLAGDLILGRNLNFGCNRPVHISHHLPAGMYFAKVGQGLNTMSQIPFTITP